jgi:hypothetical protein
MTFTQGLVEEQSKKLHDDLERQLKEELKSESDNTVPAATVFALRQKFGLAAATMPAAVNLHPKTGNSARFASNFVKGVKR